MKSAYRIVLACLFVLAVQAVVQAQSSPTVPPTGTLVAVVDIPKVFESHPQFKADRDAMQQQLTVAESDLAAKQKNLANQSQRLKDLDPASPDYKRLETQLARQLADLQVEVRQTKKDFLQREARQYYETFVQIRTAVERVAMRHSIGLVLRFDSREIDPSNPQSVAQGMSQSVVFQWQLDITHMVVEELRTALAKQPNNRLPRR